jgi:hypothetical protein
MNFEDIKVGQILHHQNDADSEKIDYHVFKIDDNKKTFHIRWVSSYRYDAGEAECSEYSAKYHYVAPHSPSLHKFNVGDVIYNHGRKIKATVKAQFEDMYLLGSFNERYKVFKCFIVDRDYCLVTPEIEIGKTYKGSSNSGIDSYITFKPIQRFTNHNGTVFLAFDQFYNGRWKETNQLSEAYCLTSWELVDD